MGIHNRPYWKERAGEYDTGGGGGLSFGLPSLGKTGKYLLLVNVGVFVLSYVMGASKSAWLEANLGASVQGWWQPWRYVTFQFLHGGFWHIGLNMLGLYLLGSPLEQHWGSRRFLGFYLSCGAFAGVAYVVMCALVGGRHAPIVGASGGVFAILLACAVLFPQFKLLLLFLPVPIRLAAVLIFGAMILVVISTLTAKSYSSDFWSQVAHLGGAVAAACYLWIAPRIGDVHLGRDIRGRGKVGSGAWNRRMKRQADQQATIDRILRKIHDQGLASLTGKERKTLQNATRQQQQEEKELKP